MAQMSKDQAEFITRDLLKERLKNIQELKDQRQKKLTEWYNEALPKEVKAFFEKFKNYCRRTTSVNINAVGHMPGRSYTIAESTSPKYGTDFLELNESDAQWLTDINNKIDDQKNEYELLRNNILAALKSLSRKQLIEEFPEVAPYLGAKTSTALAVNLVDLRKKLKP